MNLKRIRSDGERPRNPSPTLSSNGQLCHWTLAASLVYTTWFKMCQWASDWNFVADRNRVVSGNTREHEMFKSTFGKTIIIRLTDRSPKIQILWLESFSKKWTKNAYVSAQAWSVENVKSPQLFQKLHQDFWLSDAEYYLLTLPIKRRENKK